MNATKKRVVVVLGMHRSGTSAVTHALETMGVDLGDHLMPPAAGNNEKGFFEDVEINALNVELLAAFGNDWKSLASIGADELVSERVAPLRARALSILGSRLQRTDIFGFKDPRVCRVLPFWQSVFAELGLDDSYVIALRNPLSVAKSLEKRDGFAFERSCYLWLVYMLPTVLLSEGRPRLVVDYDQLMEAPTMEIGRMAQALGLQDRLDGHAVERFREQFLDDSLRHAAFTPQESAADPRLPAPVRELFLALAAVARQGADLEAPDIQQVIRPLAARFDGLPKAFAFAGEQEQRLEELQREVRDKQVHIGHIEKGYQQVSELLGQRDATVAELRQHVHDKDVHIGHIENGYRELAQRVDERDATIRELRQHVHDKDVHIANIENGYRELAQRVGEQDAVIGGLHQQARGMTAQIDSMTAQIDSMTAQIDSMAAQIESLGTALATTQGKLAQAEAEAGRLIAVVHDKDVHIGNLTQTVQRLEVQNALLNHRASKQRETLSWGLARPARAAWGAAWRAGVARPVDVVPLSQVTRTPQGWRAVGASPQFLLQAARAWHGLQGWHLLDLGLVVREPCTLEIQFDRSTGAAEVLRVPVAAGLREPLHVPVFVPGNCTSVRIRPCDAPAEFDLARCTIKRMAGPPPATIDQPGTYERLGGRTGNASELVPVSGLAPSHEGMEYGWTAEHSDPHFKVSLAAPLAPGWYMLEVLIHASLDAGAAKIYFDHGAGYTEADSVLLPFRSGVLTKRLVRLDRAPLQVRFDPIERQARFTVSRLHFGRVWGWFARDRMLRRLQNHVGEFKGRPRGEVRAQLEAEARVAGKTLDDTLLERYGATFASYGGVISYAEWIENVERTTLPSAAEVQRLLARMVPPPVFSVLVPTYNTNPDHLRACLDSVCRQSYPHWELCIADDASSAPHVGEILRGYAARDPRIKVHFRPENGHISRASNSALQLATGDFVALLDHDDELSEHALLLVAEALHRQPAAQIVYSDEDKLDSHGKRVDPHFKSDWNPDLFFAQNYLSHLGVYRRSLVESVGGFRPGVEGSQDQDLVLRCLPHVPKGGIVHIPRVLYHWRTVAGSTALDSGEKSYTENAGLRALRDYFDSQGLRGVQLESGALPNSYRVRWPVPEPAPLASLIIPTRDRRAITEVAVRSILEKTTYPNYEILIVDNGSVEPDTLQFFADIQAEDARVRVLRYDAPFNFSAINNFAEGHARGEVLGLVNNDVEVISPGWLTEMVSHACRPEIGCVGAKLYYSNDTLQHAGVILGLGGVAGHSHKNAPRHSMGYYGRLQLAQSLSAVTAACLVVRRDVYREVGGLDEKNLVVAFNDVDFCLRVQAAGYRNLWTPYAELYHHESISRGAEDSPEKLARFQSEVRYMVETWQQGLAIDPYYNPNLTPDKEDFSIDCRQR